MRAASRASYAAAQERLEAYASERSSAEMSARLASVAEVSDAVDVAASELTADQLRTVGEELLTVAGVLGREVRLRRALSDPARAGSQRAALLRGLLGDRVGEATRELLDTLVAGRWSAPSELLDGCEQLGVQALLASADQAGQLAEVEDELFRFGQVVAGDPELAAAVGDWSVPVARRAGLTDQLLTQASDLTAALVRVALGGFGGRSVAGALTRLVELAAQRRDRSVAYVTVATPLPEEAEQRLGAALSARYRRGISVKTTVDPRVLGGARVQIGADLYDGTIAYRLAQARTALATG